MAGAAPRRTAGISGAARDADLAPSILGSRVAIEAGPRDGPRVMTRVSDRRAFLERLRQVRRDSYGPEGVPRLAESLGIPARAWEDYEAGAPIPGTILRRFVRLTEAVPRWLLTGEGLPYSTICWARIRGMRGRERGDHSPPGGRPSRRGELAPTRRVQDGRGPPVKRIIMSS